MDRCWNTHFNRPIRPKISSSTPSSRQVCCQAHWHTNILSQISESLAEKWPQLHWPLTHRIACYQVSFLDAFRTPVLKSAGKGRVGSCSSYVFTKDPTIFPAGKVVLLFPCLVGTKGWQRIGLLHFVYSNFYCKHTLQGSCMQCNTDRKNSLTVVGEGLSKQSSHL